MKISGSGQKWDESIRRCGQAGPVLRGALPFQHYLTRSPASRNTGVDEYDQPALRQKYPATFEARMQI
jgi:hypothetical protein